MREDVLYMLRLWRDEASAVAWRAALVEVHSRRVTHFATVEALQAFLDERTFRTLPRAPNGADKEQG